MIHICEEESNHQERKYIMYTYTCIYQRLERKKKKRLSEEYK